MIQQTSLPDFQDQEAVPSGTWSMAMTSGGLSGAHAVPASNDQAVQAVQTLLTIPQAPLAAPPPQPAPGADFFLLGAAMGLAHLLRILLRWLRSGYSVHILWASRQP